jgi:hypothetical protein
MRIETSQAIAVVTISGKSYVVPQWIEVPVGTVLADIEIVKPQKVEVNPLIAEDFVTGSKGDEYLVRVYKNGDAECECWGYRRHKKDCKHIKQVKASL